MYAAHNPGVKAAVAWYGPLDRSYYAGDKSALDAVKDLKAPVLGLYGGADQGIPAESINKMREAMRAANKQGEIVVYPDAPHGFNADYRPSYRKEAAEDGWMEAAAGVVQVARRVRVCTRTVSAAPAEQPLLRHTAVAATDPHRDR